MGQGHDWGKWAALFWDITQRVVALPCGRFGTTCWYRLGGLRLQKEILKITHWLRKVGWRLERFGSRSGGWVGVLWILISLIRVLILICVGLAGEWSGFEFGRSAVTTALCNVTSRTGGVIQ